MLLWFEFRAYFDFPMAGSVEFSLMRMPNPSNGALRSSLFPIEARMSPALEKCGQARGVSANGELPGVARSAATGSELS